MSVKTVHRANQDRIRRTVFTLFRVVTKMTFYLRIVPCNIFVIERTVFFIIYIKSNVILRQLNQLVKLVLTNSKMKKLMKHLKTILLSMLLMRDGCNCCGKGDRQRCRDRH